MPFDYVFAALVVCEKVYIVCRMVGGGCIILKISTLYFYLSDPYTQYIPFYLASFHLFGLFGCLPFLSATASVWPMPSQPFTSMQYLHCLLASTFLFSVFKTTGSSFVPLLLFSSFLAGWYIQSDLP